MGKSRDGSVQWHWEKAATRGDHILKQLFRSFRDAESLARVRLVSKHHDLRERGLQAEQVLTIARCSLNFVAVTFGKDLLFTASYRHTHTHTLCLRRTAEKQAEGRPEHVACMGSAHEVRTRSFTQPLAPEMVGCLVVVSWRVDPGGLRLASRERLEKSAAVVARWAVGRFFRVRHEGRGGRIQLHPSPRPVGPVRHAAIGAVAQSGEQQFGRRSWWEARSRRAEESPRTLGDSSASLLSRLQKKPPSASGGNASGNGWPRRTGTRLRPQTSARMSTGPRH